MLEAWVAAPLLWFALATGAGLGVRRLAAGAVPGALVPGVGLAALTLLGWALALIDPDLIVSGLVIIALAGLVAGRAALRTPDSGAVAVGGMAFVLFAAPVVLSGEATIAGYIKLDDTATWLALADRVLDQGPDTTGLSASTYEATLAVNFENGYPFGGFVPLGAVTRISGVDLAWAFQPYLALIGALLALALWQLGGRWSVRVPCGSSQRWAPARRRSWSVSTSGAALRNWRWRCSWRRPAPWRRTVPAAPGGDRSSPRSLPAPRSFRSRARPAWSG